MANTGALVSRAMQFGILFGAIGVVVGAGFEQLRAQRRNTEDEGEEDAVQTPPEPVLPATPAVPATPATQAAAPAPVPATPKAPATKTVGSRQDAVDPKTLGYVAPDVLHYIQSVRQVPKVNQRLVDKLHACFATYETLLRGKDAEGKELNVGYVVSEMYSVHARVKKILATVDAEISRAIDAVRFKDVRVAILEHNDRYRANVMTAKDNRPSAR